MISENLTLSESDKQFVWHPYTPIIDSHRNIVITGAKGSWLYTDAGTRLLDVASSWWVNLHGHGNTRIQQAIHRQFKALDHVLFAGITHPAAISLAQQLIQLSKHQFQKVFFSDNGSTSVEVALKMAVQYWHNKGEPRHELIALQQAYHGDTFGAMSVGQRSLFTHAFTPLLFETHFIDPFDEHTALEQLQGICKKGKAAAFIYEPLIQGAAGMRMYSAQWLNEALSITKRYGVINIADEVFTGFGRTGTVFASDQVSTYPDIMCLSKGLTGGVLPLGATLCTEPIHNAFIEVSSLPSDNEGLNLRTFFHGHSYTANPIACAASLASIQLLNTKSSAGNRNRIAKKMEAFVQAHKAKPSPKIQSVRSLGTILAVDYKPDQNDSGYQSSIRNRLYRYFLDNQMLTRPLGNVLYVVPPYCITNKELDEVLQAILRFR